MGQPLPPPPPPLGADPNKRGHPGSRGQQVRGPVRKYARLMDACTKMLAIGEYVDSERYAYYLTHKHGFAGIACREPPVKRVPPERRQ